MWSVKNEVLRSFSLLRSVLSWCAVKPTMNQCTEFSLFAHQNKVLVEKAQVLQQVVHDVIKSFFSYDYHFALGLNFRNILKHKQLRGYYPHRPNCRRTRTLSGIRVVTNDLGNCKAMVRSDSSLYVRWEIRALSKIPVNSKCKTNLSSVHCTQLSSALFLKPQIHSEMLHMGMYGRASKCDQEFVWHTERLGVRRSSIAPRLTLNPFSIQREKLPFCFFLSVNKI